MEIFNGYLDRLIRPEVHLLHRNWPAYQLFGLIGLAMAILLAMTLVISRSLSPWVMARIVLAALGTFLGLVMFTKIITGEERIINYHHQIAVLVVTAVLLWLWSKPILPFLDATMLGVGLFIAGGRVGCLMAGCCYGRPHPWGVCYRAEHADAGFTPCFVGVRLFPIQAVESLWVFGIVLVGSTFVLSGRTPGEALVWYLIAYSAGRFWFEFMRGDPDRPYYWGFSEPQWTSLLLTCVVVLFELAGVLPFRVWHAGAATGLLLTTVIVALSRRFRRTAKHQLLQPRHIKEVAETLERVSHLAGDSTAISQGKPAHGTIDVGCTSLGIRISASKIKYPAGDIQHYALSSQNGPMTVETANALSRLILQLKPDSGPNELLEGNQSIFHLVIYPPPGNLYGTTSDSRADI